MHHNYMETLWKSFTLNLELADSTKIDSKRKQELSLTSIFLVYILLVFFKCGNGFILRFLQRKGA